MTSDGTVFDRWWPTTQSLDLIAGDIEAVAGPVAELFEVAAETTGGTISTEWRTFADLDEAFGSVPYFVNGATRMLLLPTRSDWNVLWVDSFLCDGSDHFLMWLTREYGLTTIHWSAHDTTTTFQPGATFHLRRKDGDEVIARRVQAARTDRRWDWFESGTPLPEEDLAGYHARRKRDRMNETRMMELLGRLDAHPWDEAWYDLPGRPVLRLERPTPPLAIRREPEQVVTGRPGVDPG